MIRVVADTNVYVSAIVFGGTCESILALARADVIELVISPEIQKELKWVLDRTFGWSAYQIREALAEVNAIATLVRPTATLSGIVPHEQDHRVLECAVAADAEYLVTGDKKHLQPLKTYGSIRIVSPREFLDSFR
ncbi:MAG: putative toxin-antitoxin system toxin component, PIN family [Nitrospirota bacterium]